jgi:Zn-dependent protease
MDTQAKAGSLKKYGVYILVVFLWYLVDLVFFESHIIFPEGPLQTYLSIGISLLIVPLFSAGVIGGIYQKQRNQDVSGYRAFLMGIKSYYWRILVADTLYYVVMLVALVLLASLPGFDQAEVFGIKLLGLVGIPFYAVSLFWFTGIVVERKLFKSVFFAIKLLLFNPFALLIGIAWGALAVGDNIVVKGMLTKQVPLAMFVLPAGIYASLKILIISYSLAIYRQINGEGSEVAAEQENASSSAGDGLVNAGFGFAFVSFLPLVHLVALVLGVMAIKRTKQIRMRAAIACLSGGFFTIFYVMVLAGLIINNAFPAKKNGYSFLSDENASLKPQVALLEKGSFQEVRQQLEQDTTDSATRSWTVDCILGIAASNDGGTQGRKAALEYFYNAEAKKPDQGEFYYYYGLTLLEDGQVTRAGDEFKTALKVEPGLKIAEKYVDLVNNTYYPPEMISALLSIIILLVSFTVHEFGHAYSAWKLGDDTAKNLGRLTLNPIAHLDLFGSIILPGIMLAQQAGMVFGWAKPVPVDPRNFKDPRKDHMIVSLAGPATNLLLAMACLVILGVLLLVVRLFWPETISLDLATPFHSISLVGPPFAKALVVIILFIKQVFYTSLVLGCLNLLPFPPLDGSWILAGMLPENLGVIFAKIRGFGSIIFLVLVFTSVLDFLLSIPMGAAWFTFEMLFSAIGVV